MGDSHANAVRVLRAARREPDGRRWWDLPGNPADSLGSSPQSRTLAVLVLAKLREMGVEP